MNRKVAILTSSFATGDTSPLEKIREAGFQVVLNPHKRVVSAEEIEVLANGADGIIAGVENYSVAVLEKLKSLKVISRVGVGLESIDMNFASSRGIQVFNTPDAVTAPVAELTIGLMLNLLRKVNFGNDTLKKGGWDKPMGSLVEGKRVGIIGYGRIGKKVSLLLQGFNVEVSYYDRDPLLQKPLSGYKTLNKLLSWADIVTLHCTGLPKGSVLIGKNELFRMKKGSWLINTARGGLVDETALFNALKTDHVSGAALDVFDQEPYKGPLNGLTNTLLTPHIGSYAKESRARMEAEAAQNLIRGLGL